MRARTVTWKGLLASRRVQAGLGWLGAWSLRVLGSTWRISTEGALPARSDAVPVVGAFWHRYMLIAAFVFRDTRFGVPVSRSRDGDLIAATLRRLGYAPSPRGSSSRGGATALRALVRMVRAGTSVSIQTDGPRGPARESKVGIVALARITGAPIVPMAFSASPSLHFRSWDRTLLPLPFARVRCVCAPELEVCAGADADADEKVRLVLDRELNRLTDAIDGGRRSGAGR